ncbi:hypothetical protein SBA1_1540003 [Candidatus Sulfotelmatobacter kueseliae]|uniref:Uncharacterized protein n=1 Tax=Candidatus Sulfotelmatobacter kueseliae TaxID=2042962 RepID=A0A2U3KA43_9BACT|nr:hypothetical protein SBA1_1540003 [Candidatus Sulfotelmatobacter kueseliae]
MGAGRAGPHAQSRAPGTFDGLGLTLQGGTGWPTARRLRGPPPVAYPVAPVFKESSLAEMAEEERRGPILSQMAEYRQLLNGRWAFEPEVTKIGFASRVHRHDQDNERILPETLIDGRGECREPRPGRLFRQRRCASV